MQIIILRNTKVVVACLVLVACHADNAGEMSNAPGPAMLAGDYYVAPDGSDAPPLLVHAGSGREYTEEVAALVDGPVNA